ncbi:uncharacterized protein F4807DRAFT_440506 [Annulohypoxylon truncatum]|uniref:uncharacterized protein n=1 Tax=Annulohypoxylon truncatum TaxID=327061 RepID=UPI002008CF0C|nr:uncharacterized protein F4807DRAFT_440506 [Annulohypoxylon truncatum]KAI1206022.1 hypothetical protein F4807DRAFT_440506 [Annulohypoxylon truncatum]
MNLPCMPSSYLLVICILLYISSCGSFRCNVKPLCVDNRHCQIEKRGRDRQRTVPGYNSVYRTEVVAGWMSWIVLVSMLVHLGYGSAVQSVQFPTFCNPQLRG